jgi:DNA processing protein
LNQYYPKENENVQREIEKRGLVVSQFSPANRTERWFFPLRNGVMSGLSLATVIMEAGETSGALKQADFALKQDRQVLIPASAFNIPNVTWPRRYVERGAQVVNNSTEILKALSNSHIFNADDEPTQQTISDYLSTQKSVKYEQASLFDWFEPVTVGD